MYTLPRCLPSTLITDAVITDSVIGGGCILNVRNCFICLFYVLVVNFDKYETITYT